MAIPRLFVPPLEPITAFRASGGIEPTWEASARTKKDRPGLSEGIHFFLKPVDIVSR